MAERNDSDEQRKVMNAAAAAAPDGVDPRRHAVMLAQSPMAYAAMVESVSAFGIFLIDARGHIMSWNQGAERQTGLKPEQVLKQPYATLYDDAARAAGLPQQVLGFAKYHDHFRDEHLRRRANGEQYTAQATLDVIRDDQGRHTGFVEVVRDVTEERTRHAALYRQATVDSLTGLPNRANFEETANREIERAIRDHDPLSVAVGDIDSFKLVNDTHGHHVGDIALKHVAGVMQRSLRKIDSVGRIGGEEFALLLPRANTGPAIELCERLRVQLCTSTFDSPVGPLRVTISIGVATLDRDAADLKTLLERADKGLYKAKRNGRNRVETIVV